MPESTHIGESACYFAANQPMCVGIQIVYSLEVEHCIQCTVLCYVHKSGGMDMTNIVTLAYKVQVDKRTKGVVLSRLTFKQSPHSAD